MWNIYTCVYVCLSCIVNQKIRVNEVYFYPSPEIENPWQVSHLPSVLHISLAGYPASLGPLLPCLPPSPFLPPCPLPPVRPSLSPSSERGYNKYIDFLGSSWHFPDFFDTLKKPTGPPWRGVGQFFLAENESHISRICVPNLVAVRLSCRKRGGGYRQADR